MSISRQSRRKFLEATSAFAVGSVLAGASKRQAAQPAIRKDLATLDVNSPDIQAYAKAYQAMQKLDPSDPHSWSYQANMHGVDPPDNGGPDGVWNTCQHGNWWFFPWHRMYLYYFERIIRKYSGNPNFALPYWHWDNPDGSQLVLHPAFLPGGPLFIPQRSAAANGGQPIDAIDNILNDPRSGTNAAMAEQRFFISNFEQGFGGPFLNQPIHFNQVHGMLENDGHDIIHGDAGGDSGLMSDPLTAADDPLFWVHHANVDRLWIQWLKMGGQRSSPSPSDSAGSIWYQGKFSFFDENKMKVTMGPADVLDCLGQLGYTYDMYPDYHPPAAVAVATLTEDPKKPPKPVAESIAGGKKIGAGPLRITFELPDAAKAGLDSVSKGGRGPAQLTIHGVKIKGNRGSNFRVYLNLAEGEDPPGIKDPRYAGTFTFFRHGHDDMGVTATIPLTEAVRDLRKAGLWKDGELSVTLVQRRASERKESVPEIPFEKLTVDLPEP